MKPAIFTLIGFALFLNACAPAREMQNPADNSCLNGYSGMANIDDSSYLVVHDKKPHHPGDRLSIIQTVKDENFIVTSVPVSDWKHSDGPSSDLEAVCKIPGRANEYLAVESGEWDKEYGRLFHFQLNLSAGPTATMIHVYDMPVFDPKGPGDAGDEIEGLECVRTNDERILLISGERGGSEAYMHGKLRWATLDTSRKQLNWTPEGRTGKTIDAPGVWVDSTKNRDITALHLDEDQILWAIASEDSGDAGPFKSLLYRIGTVSTDEADPIQLFSTYTVTRRTDGLKVEALAGPSDAIPQSVYAIATEDECFGGVWRPLE